MFVITNSFPSDSNKKISSSVTFYKLNRSCLVVWPVNVQPIRQISQSVVPEDEQVLFDPETLGTEVPPAAFAQATGPTRPFLRVAVQLRELHQLVVLEGVVVTRLFPHARSVDDQGLLHQRRRS